MADFSVDEVQERLQNALADAFGEILTGWTVVADTITDEGHTASWSMAAENQTTPTTLGHAAYLDAKVRAMLHRGEIQ